MSKKHHETRAVARALRKYHRLEAASAAARREAQDEEAGVWQEWGGNDGEGPPAEALARAERLHAEAHALNIKACAAGVRAGLAQYAEDGVTLVWRRVQYPRPITAAAAEINPVVIFGDIAA